MNNEPVAWMSNGKEFYVQKNYCPDFIPLYTHPAKTQDAISIQQALEYEKAFEEGRQLGMLQERALWNLTESTQEIENSHPADLTNEEILEIITKVSEEQGLVWLGDKVIFPFARAILRKAQEK